MDVGSCNLRHDVHTDVSKRARPPESQSGSENAGKTESATMPSSDALRIGDPRYLRTYKFRWLMQVSRIRLASCRQTRVIEIILAWRPNIQALIAACLLSGFPSIAAQGIHRLICRAEGLSQPWYGAI